MPPTPRIRLLGRFELLLPGNVDAAPESARAESLLAHLLLHRDAPQPRRQVAALLWPDSTEAQARTNLRHLLHTLRARSPAVADLLEVTARTLRWHADVWLDVAEFDRLLATGADGRCAALRAAVALYGGDLLDGHDDEWLQADRDRLRARFRDALAELAALNEARGEPGEAVVHAERLLREDPLREDTYRRLMRLHDAGGDRARAVAVYHECASTLERELGVAPSAATRAAYEALLPGVPSVPQAEGPPLVGRAAERARLTAAWRAAETGRAELVVVGGEPGVGKSRLVEEFRAWCARRGAAVADAHCYAAEGELAYGPVVAWLRGPALRPRLRRLDGARLTEIARLLPELLVEVPGLEPPGGLPAGELRHRLLDAVAEGVLTSGAPVLLTLDDLQHADRETCALLHYLLRVRPQARLLVVATARLEEIDAGHPARELLAGLHALDRCAEIELGPLAPGETAVLAERLTGDPLPAPDAARLHAETDGNALFVVEALRAGWAPGRPPGPRVQAVIGARLAQLSPSARGLAEAAATIGREFRVDVLGEVADLDDDALVRGLDELWRRRVVRERSPDTYDFGHQRIREVAAAAVGPLRRRRLHERIARALARVDAADPARIAAHHELAGEAADAVGWYRRAAEAAQLRHADRQAVDLLERALAQLATLPPGPDRDRTELAVRTAVLAPLAQVDGYASPATSRTQQRARALSRATGTPETPPLLRSLGLTALTESDFAAATRFGRLLHASGERAGDDVQLVEAHYVLGVATFWQADFTAARTHFERAVAHYRPEHARTHLIHYAQDPKVTCLGRLANTLWFLGHADEAIAAREAALTWADELGHPLSRGVALLFGALLALDTGDEDQVRRYTAAMAGVAVAQPPFRMSRAAFEGYVAVLDGAVDAGLDRLRALTADPRAASAPGQRGLIGRILLAAAVASGDPRTAGAAATDLLDLGGAACVWAPEARRVLADLARTAT